MGVQRVMNTGRSGMMASQTAIATAGHNITNATTEGYSRQRVGTVPNAPEGGPGGYIGRGVYVSSVKRVNDDYLEKQIRASQRDMSQFEEKDVALTQLEDVFNELNGDGINRLMTRFFNEFRKLANEPESEAVRQSVREAAQALVNDFHRIRNSVEDVRKHIDSRIGGYVSEINSLSNQVRDLNMKIIRAESDQHSVANDLQDERDRALKKLSAYMDLTMRVDESGKYFVDLKNLGPLIAGPVVEKFWVERSGADDQGKPEGAFDLMTSATASENVTHRISGGKLGGLLEVRDGTLSTVLARLDDLAYSLATSVNQVHQKGFTKTGQQGLDFFSAPAQRHRAAEFIGLSSEVVQDVNNIAAASQPGGVGDNRIALALAGLQNLRLMSDGTSSIDDFYNSIVSEVGVSNAKNRSSLNQQKSIDGQLAKFREQISGVSIDEETANLMQFQHSFDASAKVIQVADEMMKTVLELRR